MAFEDIEVARARARECYRKNRLKIIEKSKAYRESNKEKIRETQQGWYEKHKDEYLSQKNRKVDCEYGKTISWNNRHEHYRSEYHKTRVNTNESHL
jgi:ribosomal protein L20